MSRIRYLLAAMVGASLTASCGVPFRAADQPKSGEANATLVPDTGSTSDGSRSAY
jgi:hypothetical protein